MPRSNRTLLAALVVLALGVPQTAAAEIALCEVLSTDPAMGFVSLDCSPPTTCTPGDTTCDALFTDPVCGTSLMDLPNVCRPHCGTVVGCDGDSDCRPFRGAVGGCHVASSDPPFAVCGYPALGVTYCATGSGPLSPTRFAACHTTATGGATSNYFDGDCDGDGCPNGGDMFPCVFDKAPCLIVDPTIACSIATAPDAGVLDGGGAIGRDAGIVTPLDAGTTEPLDAGPTEPLDGGSSEPLDAPAPIQVSFGGGGGCRCAVGGGAPSAGLFVALGGLLLALVRRRG